MQTYNAAVRLAGSLHNEVEKTGVTAAEIVVLRRLHGADAVTRIKPAKHTDKTDMEVRKELEQRYGRALRGIEGVKTLDALLGPPGVPLPKTVDGVDSAPPPKTGRRASAPKQSEPETETAEDAEDPAPEFT